MKLQKPKGTQDILPAESAKWQYVEGFAREIFKRYNYAEVRTPIFEHYEVISRSVGDTTDIVTKEMYDSAFFCIFASFCKFRVLKRCGTG